MPDRVIIFIAHCVIGIIPVHEISQVLTLLDLNFGELLNPFFTFSNKLGNAVFFNVFFTLKSKFFFYLDFNPKALTIKPVLESFFIPLHIPKPLQQILVSSTPAVMNPHWIIGRNRAVKKRKLLLTLDIFLKIFFDYASFIPMSKELLFHLREIRFCFNRFKIHPFSLSHEDILPQIRKAD